jgi:peptidyl-prolyl cis-trans isomerase-like protein 2
LPWALANPLARYITAKEYAEGFGGKEAEKAKLERPLPFYCCSLSLQPFEDPVITPDGTVYDVMYDTF